MSNYVSFFLMGVSGVLSMMTATLERGASVHSVFGAIQSELTPFNPEHQVIISSKQMTPNESKLFLGHNLISRGVVPVQIDVQNNTANEYSLCASSIDLPHIDPKKVAFKVSKSAIPRAIGWKIASLFFWPLMIPSTIDGIRTYAHYKSMRRDYQAKSLKEKGEIISPYSTFHRILFVPKDELKEVFQVTIIDLETLDPISTETHLIEQKDPLIEQKDSVVEQKDSVD